MKNYSSHFAAQNSVYDQGELDHEQKMKVIKFELFLQLHQAEQIAQALTELATADDQQNETLAWFRDNPQVLDHLLDDLLDHSLLALDGISLDQESVKLSVELMDNVNYTIDVVEDLLAERVAHN
jgi:phage-related protein